MSCEVSINVYKIISFMGFKHKTNQHETIVYFICFKLKS